jgi:hypothetical protein
MNRWPTIEREPLALPASGHTDELWATLVELTDLQKDSWTLIGGQMVLLHALENGATLPRVSTDLDILVNARVITGGVRAFSRAVESQGFDLDGVSPEGLGHRYRRATVSIDVLAPDGLGPRTDLTTTPPGRTVQVPGGTQALNRTELVPVASGELRGLVPRPSLLGAIVTKAASVAVDDVPDAQRIDLALLLSLVDDPIRLRGALTQKDHERLRTRPEMARADLPAWSSLPPDAADRGRAAYGLLIS